VRFDEKAIDGPDLELEQNQHEVELEEDDQEEVPDIVVDELLESQHENAVLAAMREILERRQIVINDLKLPQRELKALEALQAAVSGKDGKLSQFVYATDRQDLLEQALAVLQPKVMSDLTKPFDDLIARVAQLRHGLQELEDAQDELLEANREVGVAKADTDTDDKKPPKRPDDEPGMSRRGSAAEGQRGVVDMSLDGPEREFPKPVTDMNAPAVRDAAPPPTTLTGERKEDPKLPSTLDGPALAEAPPPPTTVGSKEDLAAAEIPEPQRLKTKPFWTKK
jgi:hypothetical protein